MVIAAMPTVALVSPPIGNAAGGVERFTVDLARVLQEAGWTTEFIASTRSRSRLRGRLGLGPLAEAHSIRRRLQSLSPDLVVTNGYLGAMVPPGPQRIHVYHGTMVGHLRAERAGGAQVPLRAFLSFGVAESLSAGGSTTVAVSESAGDELARDYRVHVDAVIANGVDLDRFCPRSRTACREALGLDASRRIALFVGRLEARKGADLLLPSCTAAGYELMVAGRSAPHGARDLGILGPEDLAVAYGAADCLLFPTRYEACSYVILEAMAAGLPVVTTAVGWMRTMLRDVPAYRDWIVEPTVDSVASALGRLPHEDLPAVVAQARSYVTRHNSISAFGTRWQRVIASVAGNHGGP